MFSIEFHIQSPYNGTLFYDWTADPFVFTTTTVLFGISLAMFWKKCLEI